MPRLHLHYKFYQSPKRTALLRSLLALCLLLLVLIGPVHASSFRPRVESIGASILINGRAALFIPGPNGSARARIAALALARSGARSVVAVKVNRRRWAIATSNGYTLISVSRADTRLTGGTPRGLAIGWAASLRSLIALPAIVVAAGPQPLVVPADGFRSFTIDGAALPNEISVKGTLTSIASPEYFSSSRTVTVHGVSPGIATVIVDADDGSGGIAEKQITVLVENPAGSIDTDADATVTGSPTTTKDVLMQAVRTAVYRSVKLQPNAFLEVIAPPDIEQELKSGSDTNVRTRVRAVGSDLIPVEQTVTVHIHNDSTYSVEAAQALFYSNNPETVKQPQTLFHALLPAFNHPVRLVYHHQNSSSEPLTVRVEVVNISPLPAAVHVIRGLSSAVSDPVTAGSHAGADFFHQWHLNSGQDITIPAATRLELSVTRTQPGDVASGIVELSQIDGTSGSLVVRVDAEPTESVDSDGLRQLVSVSDPEIAALPLIGLTPNEIAAVNSEASSNQVYAAPTVVSTGSYTVGGKWLRVNIGTKDAVARASGGGSVLDGNYGVVYTISITLTNPTAAPHPIVISFESEAGSVSGVFSFDSGGTALVSNLYPPNEQEIDRVVLPAGASQTVQIQTIPLSGSAYPATIVAHAL